MDDSFFLLFKIIPESRNPELRKPSSPPVPYIKQKIEIEIEPEMKIGGELLIRKIGSLTGDPDIPESVQSRSDAEKVNCDFSTRRRRDRTNNQKIKYKNPKRKPRENGHFEPSSSRRIMSTFKLFSFFIRHALSSWSHNPRAHLGKNSSRHRRSTTQSLLRKKTKHKYKSGSQGPFLYNFFSFFFCSFLRLWGWSSERDGELFEPGTAHDHRPDRFMLQNRALSCMKRIKRAGWFVDIGMQCRSQTLPPLLFSRRLHALQDCKSSSTNAPTKNGDSRNIRLGGGRERSFQRSRELDLPRTGKDKGT